MRKSKYLIATLFVLCVAFFFPAEAAVAEPPISPMESAFFSSHTTYLYKTSSTSFNVWFDVTSNCAMMQELGVSKIIVQRSSNGQTWITMRTYFPSQYSQMICKNTCMHGGEVAYNDGIVGYYYRAQVTFYAKNSSGSGTITRYTSSLKL